MDQTENTQAPATTTGIPEEYLTDEDLYPVAPNGQSTTGASAPQKKIPILLVILGGVVLLLFLILIFVGLLKGGARKDEKITLSYWGLWEKESVMQEMIRLYKISHPNVDIEYMLFDAKDNYRERLIERTKKGTGPDIFRYHNTWVPQLIGDVLTSAPNTVFTPEDFRSIYYPVIAKDLVYKKTDLAGKVSQYVVGVPLGIDGLVLIYNDKILKGAGFNAPPTDWEELIDMAQKSVVLDASGAIVTGGVAMGSSENVVHFSDILGLMFLQNSVNFKALVDDPNAVSVMETYTNFVQSSQKYWSEQMENSILSFTNEKVAMIFAPSWEVEVIKRKNPDVSIKVAQVPQIKGGARKNLASYWVEGVSRGSKNQQAAWEFLKFLSTKENLTKLYEMEVKSGRLYGYAYPRQDMAELLLQNEYIGAVVKDGPIYDSLPFTSATFDNGLDDDLIRYMKDAVNGILANDSPQNAVSKMSSGFSAVYTQYKIDPAMYLSNE